MTWTGILDDVNVVVWGCWAWHLAKGTLRERRERNALGTMERDRWARLASGSSLDTDLGTRIARSYLRGATILDREECNAVTAYVIADVSGRWPPTPDDLRHVADAIAEPESLDYLRSVVPSLRGAPPDGAVTEITDDTATAVTIRLLFTFCPPGRDRDDYLTSATFFSREAADLPAGEILPVLLLRRGTNDRAVQGAAS